MRVLLVSNMYPDKENPQYGVFVKNSEDILVKNNIETDRIVVTKEKNKFFKILAYIKFYFYSFIKSLFGKYDFIYVHYLSHSSFGIIIAKLIKPSIKIIANAHGSDIVPENRKQELFSGITKQILKSSYKVIVPSNYYKNLVNKKFNTNLEKIYVFPSGGVDNNIFKPLDNKSQLKESLGLDKAFSYIGFIGRLEYKKGWDVLLDAINILKSKEELINYKFIFVGNGKEQRTFEEKIKEYNLESKIIHYNFLEHKKLKDLYNCLDLFCFPTMREGESLGLVGIEALACGITVIASNFAGPKDYVFNGENGYLFEKGNSIELSNKIIKFINLNEEEKAIMRRNAFESSKKFWQSNVEEILIEIFKS